MVRHGRATAEVLRKALPVLPDGYLKFLGKGIDDGCQHAHVIRSRAVHAPLRCRQTAPNVSATNYDRYLDIQVAHFLDTLSDLAHDCCRDVFAPAALLHCLAAQFQHDAFIDRCFGLHERFTTSTEDVDLGKHKRWDHQRANILVGRPVLCTALSGTPRRRALPNRRSSECCQISLPRARAKRDRAETR